MIVLRKLPKSYHELTVTPIVTREVWTLETNTGLIKTVFYTNI